MATRDKYLYPLTNYVTCDKFYDKQRHVLASVTAEFEPVRYSNAVVNPKWREVMQKEIVLLDQNGTWELTPLPSKKRALGSKWVYKIKYKADGSIERYSNTQQEGINFTKMFAPVAKMVTVRTLLLSPLLETGLFTKWYLQCIFPWGFTRRSLYEAAL